MNPKINPGLFNVNELASRSSYGDVIKKFLHLESQTADELRAKLWGDTVINSDKLIGIDFNYLPVREKPIFYANDGRAIIIDPIFFSEKLTAGPLFHLPKKERKNAFTDFGKAFENYACDILKRMFPDLSMAANKRISSNVICKINGRQEFEIDACLNDVTEVVLFETKTGLIREDKILDDDYEIYIKHLREKYATENKGVGQLAKIVQFLASRKWLGDNLEFDKIKKIYPIIVVHDQLLSAPVYGEFFASEFLRMLGVDSLAPNGQILIGNLEVTLPIIVTIDDLENLETSIEHFGFKDMLADYSKSCPDRLVSLHNFIATSDYNQKMYQNKSIANSTIDIVNKTKKAFFPDAPDFEFPS